MYELLRFLHVLSAMAYFLFHGAVASVTFALRREQDPRRIAALDPVMDLAYLGAPVAGGILILTGFALAFLGDWWRDRWLWASIGGLLLLGIAMNRLGRAALADGFAKADRAPGQAPVPGPVRNPGRVRGFMQSPGFLTGTGLLGLGLLLWLMMFKPF